MEEREQYCPDCGKKLIDNPKFCSDCGKKIINEELNNESVDIKEITIEKKLGTNIGEKERKTSF